MDFPVPVMHLSNGLSIYRHSLRPAGDRSKIYCIGGSLPVLAAFEKTYGHQFRDMAMMGVDDLEATNAILFDGDVNDPTVRNQLPALLNESYRQQQGEDDCNTMQTAMLFNTISDNSNQQKQMNFRVLASNKMTP